MKKNNPYSGFTLLEVLLTIGITAIVLVSAYSTMRSGWLTYNRLDIQAQSCHNLRNGLNNLSKDLRNAFIFNAAPEDRKIAFKGSQSEMSFATLIKSTSKSQDKEADYVSPAKVLYKFENNQLLKAVIKGPDMLKTSPASEYDVFLDNISALKFSYAIEESNPLEWQDTFKDKEKVSLPCAVRITITQKLKGLTPVNLTKRIKLFQAAAEKDETQTKS